MNKILKYCLTAFIIIVVLGIIIGILIANDENAKCKNRADNCLAVYKKYPLIKQNPIPNGGKYYNQFFKKDKYYGLRDFFLCCLI